MRCSPVRGGSRLIPRPPARPRCARRSLRGLRRRHGLERLDAMREVLPVLGSREALFAFAQTVIDASRVGATVVMPNPFYQIYEGAALLAGAEAYCVNALAANGFAPQWNDVPSDVWARTQLLYVCSPDNPTGRVAGLDEWRTLFELSDRHGFVIASDECYSEVHFDEARPPLGALAAAQALGRATIGGSSRSAACRSARIRRDCARATWPATPRSCRRSCSIAPITARRCPRPSRARASPRGATKRTCARTAPRTHASSRRCSRGSRVICRARCPMPRSTCGRARPATTPCSRSACSPSRTSP